MAVKSLQRSFAGGEISPEAYGRLDLGRYQTALALCRNMRTLPHGPAENRAGFEYILETKDSTKQSVLLPFSFNDQQTYVLEFGDQYARFHTQGGTLLEAAQSITGITQANPGVVTKNAHSYNNGDWLYLTATGMTQLNGRFVKVANKTANTFELTSVHGGANINTTAYGAFVSGTMARVYEVATPYLEADLFELHITQSADVLTITHNNYAQRELSRLSAASWSLSTIVFKNGPFKDMNEDRRKYVYLVSTGYPLSGCFGTGLTLMASDAIFSAGDVGKLIRVEEWPDAAAGFDRSWVGAPATGGAGGLMRYGENWYVGVSPVGPTPQGNQPPTHTEGVRPDGQMTATAGILWKFLSGGYGCMRITGYTSPTQVTVDVEQPLPPTIMGGYGTVISTTNLNGDGVTRGFSYAHGGTDIPQTGWFEVHVNGVRQRPFNDYIVNDGTDVITFSTPPPVGVNNITVVKHGQSLLTTQYAFGAWSAGDYPGCVSYFGGRITYGGSVSEPQGVWLSRPNKYKDFDAHLTIEDDDAIDLLVADRKVNVVRDLVALDQLVAMTASRAWAIVGDVDNVLTPTATVRPGAAVGISTVQAEVVNNSHALYVDSTGNAVRKLRFGSLPDGTQGYVADDLSLLAEHLLREKTIVDIAFQQKPYPTLWCVRSDGTLLSLSYAPEHDVIGWHQHDTDGFFESVAVINEGTEDSVYVVVRRTINARTVRYVERLRSRRFVTLADCFHVDAGDTYSGAPTSTITGLHHLEGRTVRVVADGAQFNDAVVVNGAITISQAASKVHIGLAYVSDGQLLPMSIQLQAFGQGTQKNVNKVFLRLINSSGIKAGPDFDHLTELPQRTDETYGSPEGVMNGLREVAIEGTWTDDGQVCWRQDKPLPMTVSAVVLEAALGG